MENKKEYLPTYFFADSNPISTHAFPCLSNTYSDVFFFWLKKMYVPNALFYAGLVLDENSKTFLPDGWHHVEYPPQFETHIPTPTEFFSMTTSFLSLLYARFCSFPLSYTPDSILFLKFSQMSHFWETRQRFILSYFMISSPSHSPIMWFSSWG